MIILSEDINGAGWIRTQRLDEFSLRSELVVFQSFRISFRLDKCFLNCSSVYFYCGFSFSTSDMFFVIVVN